MPPVPRKTLAQKAQNSALYHEKQIKDAYASGEIDAPLTAAMRWLYAALHIKAIESPAEAPAVYKHATDAIAAYAAQLQHRTATKAGK